MALVVAGQIQALAEDIVNNISYMTTAQKTASYTPMQNYLTEVMQYIVDEAEVNTTLDVASPSDLTVVVAGAPVPVLGASIGGAAAAATAAGTVT